MEEESAQVIWDTFAENFTEIIDDHYGVAPMSQVSVLRPANRRWHVEDHGETICLLHYSGLAG
jgi:hypothetical protein